MKNFSKRLFRILSVAMILSALTGCSIDSQIKQRSAKNNIVFVIINNSNLENITPDDKELFPEIFFNYRSTNLGIYCSMSKSTDSSEFFKKNSYDFFIAPSSEYLSDNPSVEVFLSFSYSKEVNTSIELDVINGINSNKLILTLEYGNIYYFEVTGDEQELIITQTDSFKSPKTKQ